MPNPQSRSLQRPVEQHPPLTQELHSHKHQVDRSILLISGKKGKVLLMILKKEQT